ncbi:MAG TPA: tetratricopeptide repeat protein [Rhizobiales bacterium]|nr:tetratricopeptide repeat protein [Hyphomicrobiales bacterium]
MPVSVFRKTIKILSIILLAASLPACMTSNPFGGNLKATKPIKTAAGTTDIALKQGKIHFLNGDYGNAERYFRIAVENSARNVNAWIGLAAAYDRLSRFKLARRAYAQAIELGGKTPVLLNNMGYSYLLQGKLAKARKHFLMASRKAPDNIQIKNNLALARASAGKMAELPKPGQKSS